MYWMCEAYVKMRVGIWWVLLWCVCIVMCGGVMCGFCTLWMCEAYVILSVGIWCGSIELVIMVLCDFVYFVMCRVVYMWVLYCMDV